MESCSTSSFRGRAPAFIKERSIHAAICRSEYSLLMRQAQVTLLRASSGAKLDSRKYCLRVNRLDRMKIILHLDTAMILRCTSSAKMLRTGSMDELILRVLRRRLRSGKGRQENGRLRRARRAAA